MNFENFNSLRIIWSEFIYGAHLTAVASMSLVLSILILMDIEISVLAIIIAYLTTYIVYTYNYQRELENDVYTDLNKTSYLHKKNIIFPYTISVSILLIIILLSISFNINGNFGFIIFILILISGGILYTIVFKVLTRSIPGFKSVYTAALWAYAGSTYAYFFYALNLDWFCVLMFLFMFIKILINAIYFDIKDIESDKRNNLKTIPILLGRNHTLLLLHILNILSLIILIFGIYMEYIPLYGICLALFFFYTESYLILSKNADHKRIVKYTYIMPDTEYILWPILLIIVKLILNMDISINY